MPDFIWSYVQKKWGALLVWLKYESASNLRVDFPEDSVRTPTPHLHRSRSDESLNRPFLKGDSEKSTTSTPVKESAARSLSTIQALSLPKRAVSLKHAGVFSIFKRKRTKKSPPSSEEEPARVDRVAPETVLRKKKNFFVGLCASVRYRVANLLKLCLMCNERHNCRTEKPFVCCNSLCLFRYQEMRLDGSLDECEVCPFPQCSSGMDFLEVNNFITDLLPGEEVIFRW